MREREREERRTLDLQAHAAHAIVPREVVCVHPSTFPRLNTNTKRKKRKQPATHLHSVSVGDRHFQQCHKTRQRREELKACQWNHPSCVLRSRKVSPPFIPDLHQQRHHYRDYSKLCHRQCHWKWQLLQHPTKGKRK